MSLLTIGESTYMHSSYARAVISTSDWAIEWVVCFDVDSLVLTLHRFVYAQPSIATHSTASDDPCVIDYKEYAANFFILQCLWTSLTESPETSNKEEMIANMAIAFKPFEQYIQYLVEGKLAGYFNSTHRQDKATDLTVVMSTDPMLLLLDLGGLTNEVWIKRLFAGGTMFVFILTFKTTTNLGRNHLFNTSGAGKTWLSLDSLCKH